MNTVLVFVAPFLFTQGLVAESCGTCMNPGHAPHTHVVKTYNESLEHVENPHRGFVRQMITHSTHHQPLTKHSLDRLRQQTGVTMIWRTFVLDSFVTSSISDDYLNSIRHDLDAIDSASFTVVLRFCYIFEMKQSHPWGDANKNMVLHHISQLQPVFHRYEGIITSIEAGFIGAWGEWHHTEYFGNPEFHTQGHDPVTGLMPQAFSDRKEVLISLLRAAPLSIQIQLRYPAQKMHMMGEGTAFLGGVQEGRDECRTGHHNDCFVSSDKDVGTYKDKAREYPYLERDTRYTIMGGETCRLTDNHRHECPTATQEMAMFHWTFLNQGYNTAIYSVWKQQGCFETVHRLLGYRLTITKAILPKTVAVNGSMCFHLEFLNTGYAAPVKNVQLYIVLQNSAGSQSYAAQIPDVDLRDWQPHYTQNVTDAVRLSRLPEGQYKVMLQLRDPLMGDRADYNVLLASKGVPLYSHGLNDLGHTINVSGQTLQSTDCPTVSSWHPPTAGHYSRLYQGSFQ